MVSKGKLGAGRQLGRGMAESGGLKETGLSRDTLNVGCILTADSHKGSGGPPELLFDKAKCLVDTEVTGQLGGMSPLENLGPGGVIRLRGRYLGQVGTAVLHTRLTLDSISEEAAVTAQEEGRMVPDSAVDTSGAY